MLAWGKRSATVSVATVAEESAQSRGTLELDAQAADGATIEAASICHQPQSRLFSPTFPSLFEWSAV